MRTVCIVGLGYTGLPMAAMCATHGFDVLGVDTDPGVLEEIKGGGTHLKEPGLAAFVQAALGTGKLRVSPSPAPSDVFVLAVPTPVMDGHRPDLHYVWEAAQSVAPFLKKGNLVLVESTVPPGTAHGLIPMLERNGLKVGPDILLAHSPERVLPGRILKELAENDRIVGGHTPEAALAAEELYRTFVTGQIHRTDATTAEMVKLMENTFRDVNIALANELSTLAEHFHVNIHDAIALANHHPRVKILAPGPGVGGHCIAVDPWFLVDSAPELAPLITAARNVNDAQPGRVVQRVKRLVQNVKSPVITLLGMSYKADVDDVRESPALEVAHLLTQAGLTVRMHDPLARSLPDGQPLDPSLERACHGAHLLVLLADHSYYRRLSPTDAAFSGVVERHMLDTRTCLAAPAWQAAGFKVTRLGAGRDALLSSGGGPAA